MSRYIDADALKNDGHLCWNDGEGNTYYEIDHAPTADVAEVRHGEWKQVSEKYPRYVCTSCNHLFNNKEYKHCPNCGAKMDGERSENGT